MTISEKMNIFGCPSCGKTDIRKIKNTPKNLNNPVKCLKCKSDVPMRLIGKIDSSDNNPCGKVVYYFKPVNVNGVWKFVKLEEYKSLKSEVGSLTWEEREEIWKIEERLDEAVIKHF